MLVYDYSLVIITLNLMLFSRHFEHLIEQLLLLLIWLEQYFKAFEMVTNWYPRVIVVEIDKAPDPLGCEMNVVYKLCGRA